MSETCGKMVVEDADLGDSVGRSQKVVRTKRVRTNVPSEAGGMLEWGGFWFLWRVDAAVGWLDKTFCLSVNFVIRMIFQCE